MIETATMFRVFLLLGPAVVLGAPITVHDPGTFVVDRAEVLGAESRTRIERFLGELHRKSGAQVKILTVPTLGGEDVFTFTQRHAEVWKLGRTGTDNGVLILFVPKSERQSGHLRIHPGYGLEAVLPDSWCGSLARQAVDHYFRGGQLSGGIEFVAWRVANRIAGAANTSLSELESGDATARAGRKSPVGPWVVPLVLFVVIMISSRRRVRRGWGGGIWEAIWMADVLRRTMTGHGAWRGGGSFGRTGGFGGGSFGGGGRFGGGGGGASW